MAVRYSLVHIPKHVGNAMPAAWYQPNQKTLQKC